MANGAFQAHHRQFPRFNLEMKGFYRVFDLGKNDGCAEIQDLSHGGLMFISSDPLNKGDLIGITVLNLEIEMSFNARIVWTEKIAGNLAAGYRFGIEYLNVSAMNKRNLSLFIASKQEK